VRRWIDLSQRDQIRRDNIIRQQILRDVNTLEWVISSDSSWINVQPVQCSIPDQGWKIHISATPYNALEILSKVIAVLKVEGVAFKVLASMSLVKEMTASIAVREQSGKYITIYPNNEQMFVDLLQRLESALSGYSAPRILGDFKLSDCVYYRYGAFKDIFIVDELGHGRHFIKGPENVLFEDVRGVRPVLPPWVETPSIIYERSSSMPQYRESNNEFPFRVNKVLHFSSKGGVYEAEYNGTKVILKETRPYINCHEDGSDCRDVMLNEYQNLKIANEVLPNIVPTPMIEGVFGPGHQFIAVEYINGKTLRDVILEIRRENKIIIGEILDLGQNEVQITSKNVESCLKHLIILLRDGVSSFHQYGWVLRDLTPQNLILFENKLVFIDLEHMASQGKYVRFVGTEGYYPPELLNYDRYLCDASHDDYAIFAIAYFMITGIDPALPASSSHQVYSHFKKVVKNSPYSHTFRTWLVETARDLLRIHDTNINLKHEDVDYDYLLTRIDDTIANSFTPQNEWMWPVNIGAYNNQNSWNLASGSAGILEYLIDRINYIGYDRSLSTRMNRIINYIANAVVSIDENKELNSSYGLYFGKAGFYRMLCALTKVVDHERREIFLGRMRGMLDWDVTRISANDYMSGLAGIGSTLLFIYSKTGDDGYLRKAQDCGEELVRRSKLYNNEVVWYISESSNSERDIYWGFAHGLAGIIHFLNRLDVATSSRIHEIIVNEALGTLRNQVIEDPGYAKWSYGPSDKKYWPYWCSGSGGIGSALLRIDYVRKSDDLERLVTKAANFTKTAVLHSPLKQCCGIAGALEFLLDCREHGLDTHEPEVIDRMIRRIHSVSYVSAGQIIVPTEGRYYQNYGYNDGLVGIARVLMRYLNKTPRYLLDE
jgi:serine/threonine protein kinase